MTVDPAAFPGRRVLSAGLVVAAAVVAVFAWSWARVPVADLPGTPEEWSGAEAKERLAAVLERTVRLPGFAVAAHIVRRGENYWTLARKWGVDVDTVLGLNPDLTSLYADLEQSLLLANRRGSLWVVGRGDSLAAVARRAGVSREDVVAANRLPWAGLKRGQVLFLPEGEPVLLTEEMQRRRALRERFVSPLSGAYTSLPGRRSDPFTGATRHHGGVDIRARRGDPVGAAAAGRVTLARDHGGYGNCVIIRHADGYETRYGHLSRILVAPGDQVRRHQWIGRVGSTGRATGPHLHFEIRLHGKVADPLKFLW